MKWNKICKTKKINVLTTKWSETKFVKLKKINVLTTNEVKQNL